MLERLHPDPFEHQCLPVYAKQLKKEDVEGGLQSTAAASECG